MLPPVFLIIVLSAVLPYALALRPAEEAFDRALGDGAYALGTIIKSQAAAAVSIDAQAEGAIRSDSLDQVLFAVMDAQGRLLAGDRQLTAQPRPAGAPNPWIHTSLSGPAPMRVFVLRSPCADQMCEIRIAETMNKRDALQRGALLAAVLPELILGLFIVLFVFVGVRRALAPLQTYTTRLLQLGELGLYGMNPRDAVEEVRPLVGALNHLATELKAAADSQQRFLSTAAHQLRTPLAGLKAAADLARLTVDPDQMRAQLVQVSRSADRVARLAGQLLALARAEPQVQKPEERVQCNLAELAEDLIDDGLRVAQTANIDLGFELASAPLVGHPLLLRELLANLLDNALRYTPNGGRVTLRTGSDPGAQPTSWLEVEDDGPGIPADQRQSALERFVRLPGTSGQGSGLGLSIVKEICDSHGAALTLTHASDRAGATPAPANETTLGRPGLLVRITFAASEV